MAPSDTSGIHALTYFPPHTVAGLSCVTRRAWQRVTSVASLYRTLQLQALREEPSAKPWGRTSSPVEKGTREEHRLPANGQHQLGSTSLWVNHLGSESSSPVIPACDHRPRWHVILVSRKNLIQDCLVNPLLRSWPTGTTGYWKQCLLLIYALKFVIKG